MPRYSDERKEAVLVKILPPHNRALGELATEEGISEATLYNWRREAREKGRLLPGGTTGLEGWSAADKFAAVVETAEDPGLALSSGRTGAPSASAKVGVATRPSGCRRPSVNLRNPEAVPATLRPVS